MERLTDRRTAEAVRDNIEKLQAKGFEVSIGDLRYVKLAEYEDKEKRGEWEEMNDYISREDAIKKIAVAQVKATTGIEDVAYYRAIRIIRDMPAADAQPVKQGRWIISNIYARCSECSVAYDLDTFQRLIPMNENVPRHCSYCGARMKEDK